MYGRSREKVRPYQLSGTLIVVAIRTADVCGPLARSPQISPCVAGCQVPKLANTNTRSTVSAGNSIYYELLFLYFAANRGAILSSLMGIFDKSSPFVVDGKGQAEMGNRLFSHALTHDEVMMMKFETLRQMRGRLTTICILEANHLSFSRKHYHLQARK
ncbi:hypothetical protein V3C99_004139 [Haemonchus contortus]